MMQCSLKSKKYLVMSIAIILSVWQVAAIIIDNRVLLPSFFNVIDDFINIIIRVDFINLIGSSIYRCIKSFVISIVLSILFAVSAYFSRFIYNLIYIVLSFIKSIPTMAFIVLLLIWTSKEFVPTIMGILISIPIFYDVIINSLLNMDEDIKHMCKLYRVSLIDRINTIIIPIVFMEIKKVSSSTLSLIFKVVVSGEVYAQPNYGIGSIIQLEKINLNTSAVIAWMLIMTLIIYGFDFCLIKIFKFNNYFKRRNYANK